MLDSLARTSLELVFFQVLLPSVRMAGLVDDYLTAFALKLWGQLLVALVARLDDLVVVTAQDGVHADGKPDGRVDLPFDQNAPRLSLP